MTTVAQVPKATLTWCRRHHALTSALVLAVLAYVPALTSSPGRMPADSKLYVYLNPGRFIADTTTTFDPRQFAGWVPHQHIAYLWPTGPWFWFFDAIGVPDWIAHRLWIGTLLFAAGTGVRWMARVIGLAPTAALVAALVYQLSPYVLPYISRTSVLLLPWAGLGWIVGFTVLAAARGRWRFPAAIALVVLTVGAVNATALAMIIPAPALWLFHAAWRRDISWMRALTTAAKVALLSTVVSLWWMAMLIIQGRWGADVLAYSESLESVSFTSTSTEVVRGLGYWLFYIRDNFGATTAASLDYLVSIRIILVGFALLGACLLGLVATRWAHRRFAALLVGVGTILAVGVHPIDDPSPVMSVLVGDGEGGLALALRSSTRAVPVVVLGLALGAAALVGAARGARLHLPAVRWRPRTDLVLAAIVTILVIANLPSLRTSSFVDPNLERDQDPPDAWVDAAAALDAMPSGYRVLQLPGTEFGAYQWGYTVDQPLPALTERALLTRDLLPLGSPAAMDLVFALDDRFQDGVAEVTAIAPVARLLGADTVWVTGDVDFDRFRLARPEDVVAQLTADDAERTDLQLLDQFGDPAVMPASTGSIDGRTLGDPLIGQPIAPVVLVGVQDPVGTIRVKTDEVVLSGDGAGIVDAAAAGLLDGNELVRYSASLDGVEAIDDALGTAQELIVTDTNRDRAHHWRSSQDVTGYTESAAAESDLLRSESGDQRLPVFDSDDPSTQTVSVQRGPITARASAYGEPFAYLPEHRPVMAIDGDPHTSWVVADRTSAVGEFIELEIGESIDQLTLLQPATDVATRSITTVDITVDDRAPVSVPLGPESLVGDGQRVDLEPTDGPSVIRVTIGATTMIEPPVGEAIGAVGFAEIRAGRAGADPPAVLSPTVEYIRPPTDALDRIAEAPATPVEIVLTRLRVDPMDRWRSDPEATMNRIFDVPRAIEVETTATVRLDPRAGGELLASIMNEPVTATGHLTGAPRARGAAALDGDATTSWITPFGETIGQQITYRSAGTAESLGIEQPAGPYSTITAVRVTDSAGSFDVAIPPESGTLELPRPISLDQVTIEITAVDSQTTTDRRFGEAVQLPAAINEILIDGASPPVQRAETVAADCRTDLLEIDSEPIGVSFTATTEALIAGDGIEATLCDPPTTLSGEVEITTAPGAATGFQVDRIVMREVVPDTEPLPAVTPSDVTVERHRRTAEIPACPDGCWVVLGEGYNTAWTASTSDGSLGAPQLVDGNANGWYVAPSDTPTTVTFEWTAQRSLTVALTLSAIGALAALGLIVWDRRRRDDAGQAMRSPVWTPLGGDRGTRDAVITGAVAVAASALFIGWIWAVPAALACAAAALLGRRRLIGLIGMVLVLGAGVVVAAVVRDERPYPGAGWPVRFEWLHGWTLLGIILVTVATLLARDAKGNTP